MRKIVGRLKWSSTMQIPGGLLFQRRQHIRVWDRLSYNFFFLFHILLWLKAHEMFLTLDSYLKNQESNVHMPLKKNNWKIGWKISYLRNMSSYFHLYFPRSITLVLEDFTLLICRIVVFCHIHVSILRSCQHILCSNSIWKALYRKKGMVILNLLEQRC